MIYPTWTGATTNVQPKRLTGESIMSYRLVGPNWAARLKTTFKSCLAATVLTVAAGTASVLTGAGEARADAFYFGGSGVGIAIGTRGYRGYRSGFYYGFGPYGFSGPPFRPYGAPYYYHPYDRRAYPYRSRVYVNPPRRAYGQPQRVPYTKTGLAPFTPQWVAYCSRKFKSFNPNTGTYLAYSGKYRFCR